MLAPAGAPNGQDPGRGGGPPPYVLGMDQEEIWDDLVGDAWVRNAAVIDGQGRPFGEAAMDRLEPLAGRRVLDVGCGTGATTEALVARGAAAAVGMDLSSRMIAQARASSTTDRASYRLGDVGALDEPGSFDAVFSRFGVMFFDDPVASFAHLRAQVAADGQLAFCCWQGPFDNPWMSTALLASIPLLGPPRLPGPGEPGPFSLAEPDHVLEVLHAAGWSDVDIEPVTTEQPHPAGSPEAVARLVIEMAPPLAMGLAANPDKADELQAAVVEALQPAVTDEGVVLGAAVLVVSARI